MDSKKTAINLVVNSAFIAGSVALPTLINTASADSLFTAETLQQGYMVADSHMTPEGKCGASGKTEEGKCGEGKCGTDKDHEGKCGEGKCGADKHHEGKCGEGKCGNQS